MADATSAGTSIVHKAAVVIDYADLDKPVEELQDKIQAAFGCVAKDLSQTAALHLVIVREYICCQRALTSFKYRYEGLGIIAVTNVPGYLEKRKALLPLARK